MSLRTAPCAWCARAPEAVASTIAASDVPSARCITWPGAKPKATNTSPRVGTIIEPPPMPSSPEKNPTKTPRPA